MTTNVFLILYVLPFAVMAIVMLAMNMMIPSPTDMTKTGRLANFNDFHREAYVGAIAAAIASVVVFHIRGGPEPFVLFWMPLLSTVMILPFGYAAALLSQGLPAWARRPPPPDLDGSRQAAGPG